MSRPHNTNEERRARIVELMEDDELTPFEIDSIIMEEFDCTRDAARKARKRVQATGVDPHQKVENVGDEKDSVEMNLEDRQYEFKFYTRSVVGSGYELEDEFDIPFDQMQEYVELYVNQGGNKTRKQVCTYAWAKHKRQLTHDYIRRIFKVIDVQKSTTPFAPHMHEENTHEENVRSWHAKDEALLELQFYAQQPKKNRALLKKKIAELNSIKDFIVATVEEAEFSGIPECNLDFQNRFFETKLDDAAYQTVTMLSDWHIGLEVNEWYNEFNADIAKLRIDEMLEHQFQYAQNNKGRILRDNIAMLGDFSDGFHGDMHPDQHLEQGLRGYQQAAYTADLLAYYVIQHSKIFGKQGRVWATPGNHDRTAAHRAGDPQRIAGLLVYDVARYKAACAGAKDASQWLIGHERPMIEAIVDNYLVLMGHGDKTPKQIRNTAWPRLRAGMHILMLSGHLHTVQLTGTFDANFSHFQNGAMCGSTSYSVDNLGYHQYPAQMMLELHDNGVIPRPIFLKSHGCEDYLLMYPEADVES